VNVLTCGLPLPLATVIGIDICQDFVYNFRALWATKRQVEHMYIHHAYLYFVHFVMFHCDAPACDVCVPLSSPRDSNDFSHWGLVMVQSPVAWLHQFVASAESRLDVVAFWPGYITAESMGGVRVMLLGRLWARPGARRQLAKICGSMHSSLARLRRYRLLIRVAWLDAVAWVSSPRSS